MSREIYHNGLFYRFVKLLVNFGLRAYFGRIVVKGRENLPSDTPYILAPNHQNAFLDALMMLQLNKFRPTVFVARADIFGSALARKVLGFLKIMPVYRARDGKESLAQNERIFEKSVEVVLHNTPFCIMAEGTHNDRRQLLPLKKGLFRIAFAAQQRLGTTPLHIIPVGIDYESYDKPGHTAIINIGKPIAVDGYMEQYSRNNALAINAIKNDLCAAMKAQMHQIDSTSHCNDFYTISKLYADSQHCDAWERFETRRDITRKLDILEKSNPQQAEQLCDKMNDISEKCKKNGICFLQLFEPKSVTKTIIYTILFLGGVAAIVAINWKIFVMLLLLCPIPFLPTRLLFRKTDDSQFVGSLNYAVQFVLTLIYLVAMTVAVGVMENVWYALGALVAGVVVWRVGHRFGKMIKQLVHGWKLLVFKNKTTRELRNIFVETLRTISE